MPLFMSGDEYALSTSLNSTVSADGAVADVPLPDFGSQHQTQSAKKPSHPVSYTPTTKHLLYPSKKVTEFRNCIAAMIYSHMHMK